MGGGNKKWYPRKDPRDIRCRFFPNCKKGDSCRFKHPDLQASEMTKQEIKSENKVKTEPSDAPRSGIKAEVAELPAVVTAKKSTEPPHFCPHCKKDTSLPKSCLKSESKDDQDIAEITAGVGAMMSPDRKWPGSVERSGTKLFDSPNAAPNMNQFANAGSSYSPFGISNTNQFAKAGFGSPVGAPAQTRRTPVTPSSFSKSRPNGTPQLVEEFYKNKNASAKKAAMLAQKEGQEKTLVICNWGISEEAHKSISKPSLKALATASYNTDDMRHLYPYCDDFYPTDKGGSVVLFKFNLSGRADLYTEVVEFASALHIRLLTAFFDRAIPQLGDEIVVYYACVDGPVGSFHYRA